MNRPFSIIKADISEIDKVSKLFDRYRQFYQQDADIDLATTFISENIKHDRAVIFLAQDNQNYPLGFTQLYPSFCSVDAKPIWILYDLYVDNSRRKLGIGKALMMRALELAKDTGAARIDLETAKDNSYAQALYESLNYQRDVEYYKYSLEV